MWSRGNSIFPNEKARRFASGFGCSVQEAASIATLFHISPSPFSLAIGYNGQKRPLTHETLFSVLVCNSITEISSYIAGTLDVGFSYAYNVF